MCGIFAVSGVSDASNLVLSGLKDLEYRGYDSWGIGIPVNKVLKLERYTGKIQAEQSGLMGAKVAFGHTRWATHGAVSVANTHPHLDCSGRIGVVHNGMLENFEKLKLNLQKKGHVFNSQTDTEIIAHLVEEELRTKDLLAAVRLVFFQLKGYSACVIFDAKTQEFVAVRHGSPLVVGISTDAVFIASDALSLAPFTRKVIYLPDEVFALVKGNKVKFFNGEGKSVNPKIEKLDEAIQPSRIGKYPHFMLKEIMEQPQLIATAISALDIPVEKMGKNLGSKRDIVVFGCGSAYFASLFGCYLFSGLASRKAVAVQANESDFALNWLSRETYALFVSQSGETIDVLEAMRHAQNKKATTGALVNVIGSSLSREVQERLPLSSGPEVGVASTKVFTSMLTAFYLLASQLAGTSKKVKAKTIQLAALGVRDLCQPEFEKKYILPLVKKLLKVPQIFVLGKGRLYPMALEAALKLKEITYTHAEGFAAGELKHGMIALIEKGTPCIVLVPQDETKADILSSAMQVKARGAVIIGVGPKGHEIFDYHIPTGEAQDLTAIPMIVAIQLLAYHLSVAKENDPDKPRNLAKSVTVK